MKKTNIKKVNLWKKLIIKENIHNLLIIILWFILKLIENKQQICLMISLIILVMEAIVFCKKNIRNFYHLNRKKILTLMNDWNKILWF